MKSPNYQFEKRKKEEDKKKKKAEKANKKVPSADEAAEPAPIVLPETK